MTTKAKTPATVAELDELEAAEPDETTNDAEQGQGSDELEAPADECAVLGCLRVPIQSGLCGGHYATRRGDRVR